MKIYLIRKVLVMSRAVKRRIDNIDALSNLYVNNKITEIFNVT